MRHIDEFIADPVEHFLVKHQVNGDGWPYKIDIELVRLLCACAKSNDTTLVNDYQECFNKYRRQMDDYFTWVYRPKSQVVTDPAEVHKIIQKRVNDMMDNIEDEYGDDE